MPGYRPHPPLSPAFSPPTSLSDSFRLRFPETSIRRLPFKPDPSLFAYRRESCRMNIHGFYAKMKYIAIGVVATQDIASDRQLGYRVQEGDTLTAIASKFNTDVQNIARANKIADIDYIPVGKLLLIPLQVINSDQVQEKNQQPFTVIRTTVKEDAKVIVEEENTPSIAPKLASTSFTEIFQVKVVSSIFVLITMFWLVRKFVSYFTMPKHEEVVLERMKDADHYSRLKRWEGILEGQSPDEDVNADFSEEPRNMELDEEKLQESYAQLESRYLQFLADSGLSTSGYWRGGAPPASDDNQST